MKEIMKIVLKSLLATMIVFKVTIYILPILFLNGMSGDLTLAVYFIGIVFSMFLCTFILKSKQE